MKASLYDRLWRRESGEPSRYASLSGIYGSKEWVDNLDIVNELGGHTGCVNALCWSHSGRLLASGSDDKHINLYSHQPDSSTAPFALNTTLFTGHRANIFSVKFMPHSNDRTLVSCAGDSEVRIFDIEHSSNNAAATTAFDTSARSRRFDNFFDGARYLSAGNTNARVYRSHADRVKRIVTESSPFLFLTCSEDGEVRQWDLRQPSSAYPSPRGGQGFMAYRPGLAHDDSNVPPPLISYKRHQLDLNTISCSPSQPHYIALGGAHLHCFLHDRRMLGRDVQAERGDPGSSPSISTSSHDDEAMGQATRCVRRFAPGGRKRMRRRENGHITACKISDANPNEMIVSWSGDHIYSFDLVRSADARDTESTRENPISENSQPRRRRGDKMKKRKRQEEEGASMSSSQGSEDRHGSRRRSVESEDADVGDLAFRVRYGNGESEDIPLPTLSETISDAPAEVIERAHNAVLTEAQRLSMRIAKGLVKLRKALFSLETSVREATEFSSETDLTPFTPSFSSAITHASIWLPRMTDVMNTWSYPLNPTPETVGFQQSLRRNRESAWRFVQAAGSLSRVLGGVVEDLVEEERPNNPDTEMFQQIKPAPGENNNLNPSAQFGYDFLKAILLWVEGGQTALLAGFKGDTAYRRNQARYPIPEDAGEEAIEAVLIPYLQGLVGHAPVVNVDASRFEHDSTRILFPTQVAALTSFADAIKLPLEDLNNAAARYDYGSEQPTVQALDRAATKRFWVLKVGRGILMETGSGVNYQFVNRAFGGLRTSVEGGDEENEDVPERSQDDVDANVEEEPIRDVNLVVAGSNRPTSSGDGSGSGDGPSAGSGTHSPIDEDSGSRRASEERFLEEFASFQRQDSDPMDHDRHFRSRRLSFSSPEDNDNYEEDEDGDSDISDYQGSDAYSDDDDDDDEGDDIEAEEGENIQVANLLSGSNGFPSSRREDVELDVPCDSHTRVYRGHCNIKTVKDVNYFGLNDEYVVSGSDSGHLFIWDRQSGDLLNILEGDSEVVNVIQGHPYEPTIAASGIDNTIKIYSPDRKAQDDARCGINILDPDSPIYSIGRTAGGLPSSRRMHDSYRIMSQNDVDRQGGMSDAYVTRSMLARLATNLRQRQIHGDGEGTTLVVDPNCAMM